jgi:5'-nucleotidase
MAEPLRVLVTNDDGIESPGIWCLAEGFATIGEVIVVAPKHEQSAQGTAFTTRRDLSLQKVESPLAGVRAFALDGTPSDCVTTGLRRVATGRVSVVASGVNRGANAGRGILASGTLAGALQGHYRGLVSMAVSLHSTGEPRWNTAGLVVRRLAALALAGRLPNEVLLNVNVPDREPDDLAGVMVTRMADAHFQRLVEEHVDGVLRRRLVVDPGEAGEGTDVWAIANGYVSVSPFHHDLTHEGYLAELRERAADLFGAQRA